MTRLPITRETGDTSNALRDVDRILDAWFAEPARAILREGLWHPTMDIYNRPQEIVVELELPGVNAKEVETSVEKGHLIVEGTRERAAEHKGEVAFFSERAFGAFHRVVHLPGEVDPARAKATYRDGVLTIVLPKTTRERGQKITIEA